MLKAIEAPDPEASAANTVGGVLMSKKQLATDIVMQELLWCGGEQKTRKQIQDELLAEGYERRYVDWYLFCLSNHQPKDEVQG